MSNVIFPTLPGLMWDITKTPMFNNIIQPGANPKYEVRVANTSTPQYKFECSYEFLRQDSSRSLAERDTLESFFKARLGNWDSFLLKLSDLTQDPADGSATGAPAGTGNGTTTTFQLQRTTSGYTEPVDAVSATGFKVYKNGVLQGSGYTLNANSGTVTFTSAPSNGTVVTWDGTYYYRVRFVENMYDFNLFQAKLWELQSLTFIQVSG